MRISKPDLSIPRPNIKEAIAESTIWRFKLFIVAALVGMVGITLVVSGLVLVPMLAFSGSMLGVVGASAMLGLGIVLMLADYLWLTL